MSTEHGPANPGSDDFDRQLRDLTSGSAGAARFREPSAEERAKQAANRGPRHQRTGWRKAAKAKKLRRPVGSPNRGSQAPRRKRRLKVVGGSNSGRLAPGARAARLRSFAKTAGILVGFVALLIVLHLLGLGPR